jgi:BirA family biotin operon repressor/biotin-[acetyl-CoA-carboxylase] ligase
MDTQPLDWNTEALWQLLEPQLPGLSVKVVARTESTNTTLLERLRGGPQRRQSGDAAQVRRSIESAAFNRRSVDLQPCLLVAEHQTAGRGRQGRTWQSARGASLTFSLALPLSPADVSGLSLVVGVAIADALDPSGKRLGVKWPNDLWLMDGGLATGRGRKLGGILIETVPVGERRVAVIGVGLNVLPLNAPQATTGVACVQELDAEASAPGVLMRIAPALVHALREFQGRGFVAFADRFAVRDVLHGRPVTTTQPGVAEGVALGVASDGALLVETPGGVVPVVSGEVSVRLGDDTPC